MANFRFPLQKQILTAFQQAIDDDYSRQRINSENGMVASFTWRLKKQLPQFRRVFIEPRVFDKRLRTRLWYPDIVVCNSREVIAVIEMKYTPRGRATWKRDLTKLNNIAKVSKQLHVANTRYLGPPRDQREYHFSDKCIYVWMGVHLPFKEHAIGQTPRLARGFKHLESKFVQYHAFTSSTAYPTVKKVGG